MLEECRCKWWSDSLQVYTEKIFCFFPVEESYAEFAIKVVHFFFFHNESSSNQSPHNTKRKLQPRKTKIDSPPINQ